MHLTLIIISLIAKKDSAIQV